jgi:SRSO17 transposase
MRRQDRQIPGDDRQRPAPFSCDGETFPTEKELATGSAVAQKTFPGPLEGTPVGAAPNSGNDSPGMLPTKQRGKPRETSPPHRDRRVAWEQQRPTPPIADETFLTDEQLAARWQLAPKTLRNARVAGRLIGFVKIGRSVRYRLSEIIAYELQNSVRSTSGGQE